MAARKSPVTGIGGVFFKAKNPKALGEWYREHLGIPAEENMAFFVWRGGKEGRRKGHTVWSIFPADTTYFGKNGASFMINYRVHDLAAVLEDLRAKGANVAPKIEDSEYGRFGWVTDPEGNRIELWQPPKGNEVPPNGLLME